MKILVIGHLCKDVIHPVDEPETESYGGIYYSVATLASLLDPGDRVIPVFGVNTNEYDLLIGHFHEQYPNVDTSGIFPFDDRTNNVHLFYQNKEARIECSKDISRPIPFDRIKDFLRVDGILINMISGFDITVETLDDIRMAVRERKIPIHFDYHSLTLGVKDNHERYRRPVANWRRWAFMTDTVQLNEEEIAGLTVERSTEQQTVGHFLTLGIKGLVVTRGVRGATVFQNEHKKVIRHDVEGLNVERARDATGCGDVFGAAFHLHVVKTGDLVRAAEYANRVAAAKAQMVGANAMQRLKELAV
jgi:sugar/nucleoside kinase (ribokinase family)